MNGELVIKAINKIYPTIKGGFIYWETKHDLSEWENPIDGLIWENTQFEKPTWEQISTYSNEVELEEAKNYKLSKLKANKEASLNSFVLISINGINFNVYKSQLEVLAARIYYLETNNFISSNWTDNDNFRRELTLDQFRDLYSRARNHYTVLDDNTYTLYTDLRNEIKACESVEELNNININF